MLAFFLNAAIDQQVETHLAETGELEARVRARVARSGALPSYEGELPDGHDGLGLGLLGIPGDRVVDAGDLRAHPSEVLASVRGTVQADILKEDQAQNTCIFSTEFSLKMQGDIQETSVASDPELLLRLDLGLSHGRGRSEPDHPARLHPRQRVHLLRVLPGARHVGRRLRAELLLLLQQRPRRRVLVIGRVARRIWAVAMRERYGASERSQKLKYHIQTSGRSLHAQEMDFNDIRTTLQALTALQDRCNSLHTNAYDEAVTTPTEESVRRALAIQLIINRELGLMKNENPIQGAYVIEALTDLVEEAVLEEFERLASAVACSARWRRSISAARSRTRACTTSS